VGRGVSLTVLRKTRKEYEISEYSWATQEELPYEVVPEEMKDESLVEVGSRDSDTVEFASPVSRGADALADPVIEAEALSMAEVTLTPAVGSTLEADCEAEAVSALEEISTVEVEFAVSSDEFVLAVADGYIELSSRVDVALYSVELPVTRGNSEE